MIRRSSLAAVLALAACGGDNTDPCDAIEGTCVAVHVATDLVPQIDNLALDLLIGGRHATAQTAETSGGAVDLPVATAVAIDPAPTDALRVDVLAGVSSLGSLRATGYATTTVTGDDHVRVDITLDAPLPCDVGATYCGGVEIPGDP